MKLYPALLLCLSLACASSANFEGIAPAQKTGGPRVNFDLLHKPLPDVPFPNDIATRTDPTSRTGLRVNASMVAPSDLERSVREHLDGLDGFGTYAPITVSFDQDLDVLDFYTRQNDADPANDGAYLIDLVTGERAQLDVNGGHFPAYLFDSGNYFMHDPDWDTSNLLFGVRGDQPNFLHPVDANWPATHAGAPQQVDDLMTFYERATRTLILRPIKPLKPEHTHALVLTSKLKGTNGKSIESPFPGIAHVLQTTALQGLAGKLPAGVALSNVAFVWTFTTQTTTLDLEDLHEGLAGRGPFQSLATDFPVLEQRSGLPPAVRMTPMEIRDADPLHPGVNLITLPGSKMAELVDDPQVGNLLFGSAPDTLAALKESMSYVDYYVTGSYETVNLLDDPSVMPGDEIFRLDRNTGFVAAKPQTVYFLASIPKATAQYKPPFAVAMYGHGYSSARFEGPLLGGGILARHGLAMISIDAYGHGLALDPLTTLIAQSVAQSHGLKALAASLFKGRARDLDNDGTAESGGDFWTANSFHTRDVVRQSVFDWFQLVRLMKTWDGQNIMKVSQPAGDEEWLAGDFNHDGVPDMGGLTEWPADVASTDGAIHYTKGSANPGADVFNMGASLGGILASIAPAVEPAVIAAEPSAGGSGLSDIGLRSNLGLLVRAVFLEVMGPMVVTCPWSVANKACSGASDAVPALVFHLAKVNDQGFVPIGAAQLSPGDKVTVCNKVHLGQTPVPAADADEATLPTGCHRGVADEVGNVRISVNADGPKLNVVRVPKPSGIGDTITVTADHPGDDLVITIAPASGGAARTLDTFQWDTSFKALPIKAGSPLQSPARGYGKARNTPDFRRLFQLSQTILEPGDPVSYAPHYFADPLPVRNGKPVNILVEVTVGDKIVPVSAGLGTGRASGLIDTDTIDPIFGKTIDRVLIDTGVIESADSLRRYQTDTVGPRAVLGSHILCEPFVDRNGFTQPSNCNQEIMFDPTGYACDDQGQNCLDDYGAPRLSPPIHEQMIRRTDSGISALLLPYIDPTGQHAVQPPRPAQRFDMNFFMLNQAGHYFITRGKELSFDKCQAKSHECPWIPPPPAN